MIQLYNSFGVPPSFKERITCFLVFSLGLFLWFEWNLLLLVQVKHKRNFHKCYYKNRVFRRDNEDKRFKNTTKQDK